MNSPFPPRPRPPIVVAGLILATGGLACLTGCGSYPEEHVVSAPPPTVTTTPTVRQVVVTQQPAAGATVVTATPLDNGTLLITQAPPTAPQTVAVTAARPPRPGSSHVWIEGYWTWQAGQYQWVPAQWKQPPYTGAQWLPPHWEQRGDGHYTFYEGHWN